MTTVARVPFMRATTVPDPIVRDALPADAAGIASIGKVAVPETYKDLIRNASVLSAIVEQSYALKALTECVARCATSEDAHFLVA